MFRDFMRFLWAVWREWKVLLTGGSIIAAFGLWGMLGKKAPPQNVNWLIVGTTLMLAAFLAWRKEWMAAGRGFVNINAKELIDLFRGRTEVQARSLVQTHIGKYTKITGTISDVARPFTFTFVYLNTEPDARIMMSFFFGWNGTPFLLLPLGTRITVAGRISDIDSSGITLANCRLIAIDPASMRPTAPPSSTPD